MVEDRDVALVRQALTPATPTRVASQATVVHEASASLDRLASRLATAEREMRKYHKYHLADLDRESALKRELDEARRALDEVTNGYGGSAAINIVKAERDEAERENAELHETIRKMVEERRGVK
jgi:exonuclease VII large subunit